MPAARHISRDQIGAAASTSAGSSRGTSPTVATPASRNPSGPKRRWRRRSRPAAATPRGRSAPATKISASRQTAAARWRRTRRAREPGSRAMSRKNPAFSMCTPSSLGAASQGLIAAEVLDRARMQRDRHAAQAARAWRSSRPARCRRPGSRCSRKRAASSAFTSSFGVSVEATSSAVAATVATGCGLARVGVRRQREAHQARLLGSPRRVAAPRRERHQADRVARPPAAAARAPARRRW